MQRPGGVLHPADPAGFWERLCAGNLDAPASQAFNRWGRGYEEGLSASDMKFIRPRP